MTTSLKGARIHVNGIVQGVGFRPFIYSLAHRLKLTGWVRNTSAGVEIALDGAADSIQHFLETLESEAPPLAHIDEIVVTDVQPDGFSGFDILDSTSETIRFQPISPDVSLCDDCLRELLDPDDRRYRYPFINCTNCGPRFTIIQDVPYDRPKTTMSGFPMCSACEAEYHDPADRRFHAQPVACTECGPHVWLDVGGAILSKNEDAISGARKFLREGWVVGVKGLGGFHLACDATNDEAVKLLRKRKLRVDKAFAVMFPDIEAVERYCRLTDYERSLLVSRERPVVIVERKRGSSISDAVAPGQHTIGAMLPYTPLHVLLLEREAGFSDAWVMTSGNISEEPIATGNDEARERLSQLADAFLMHDRPIQTRCDDSVVRGFQGHVYPLRRSRGYAPAPLAFPIEAPPLFAAGGMYKNTFCLTRGSYAFMSHHIGDLENMETLQAYRQGITHYMRLFDIKPELVAYDIHPDYLATQIALTYAAEEGLPAVGVQHHHAHIASLLLENGLVHGERAIGVAFDGTGYGEDGTIWGGEFLVADLAHYDRAAHLKTMPLPGGDVAVRKPWRIALGLLHEAGKSWDDALAPVKIASDEERRILRRQLELGINSPRTSSMGRLFDAVSSLLGIRQLVNYEGQAAIELEAALDPDESDSYPFALNDGELDPGPMLDAILRDLANNISSGIVAAKFQNTVAAMVLSTCNALREQYDVARVALSGGVWQNMHLLSASVDALQTAGFSVYVHRKVPANDGGLSLGQAAVAASRLASGKLD